ncbi:UNVERIFIED_ORG: hypothetical protein ABIB13_000312 [Arthrobacter sp. UYEF2]
MVTGDRLNAVPVTLLASIQRRLVLRLTSEDDYKSMDVAKDVLTSSSPPGRGMLGGYSNLALQAREVHELSQAMLRQGPESAPKIQRLPELLDLDVLPVGRPDLPVIGVDDETLQPAEIMAQGPLLLAGPPGAGRTVALVTLAYALRRSISDTGLVYIGSRRSAVASLPLWNRSVAGAVSQLVPASIKADQWVIGESETSTWSSAWSLAQPFKSGRRGLLINPGDIEGDSLLNTSLGRVSPQFIPGRGYIVGRGKARKLQIDLPPENRGEPLHATGSYI